MTIDMIMTERRTDGHTVGRPESLMPSQATVRRRHRD